MSTMIIFRPLTVVSFIFTIMPIGDLTPLYVWSPTSTSIVLNQFVLIPEQHPGIQEFVKYSAQGYHVSLVLHAGNIIIINRFILSE